MKLIFKYDKRIYWILKKLIDLVVQGKITEENNELKTLLLGTLDAYDMERFLRGDLKTWCTKIPDSLDQKRKSKIFLLFQMKEFPNLLIYLKQELPNSLIQQ